MKCHKYLHQSLPAQLSILRGSRLHHMLLGVMSSLPAGRLQLPPPRCRRSAHGSRPATHGRAPGPRQPRALHDTALQRGAFLRQTLLLRKHNMHLWHLFMPFHLKKGILILKVLLSVLNPASFKDHFSLKLENRPSYFQ